MTGIAPVGKTLQPLPLLMVVLLIAGCTGVLSYRPAEIETIRDFPKSSTYRKQVGVLALSNTTPFSDAQAVAPFLTGFYSGLQAAVADAVLLSADHDQAAPFLSNPPRLVGGDVDGFMLAQMARQAGMNAVVSPVVVDIRVHSRDKGFWFFKDVAHSLKIQAAATTYDAITGSRWALDQLADEVAIDEYQAEILRSGRVIELDDYNGVLEKMGRRLGKEMGDAIKAAKWLASVAAIEDGACVIRFGSEAGIANGDRFSVLDGSGVLTGLDGRRYIVPGPKIGQIRIVAVTSHQARGVPDDGDIPPVGSILIPER
jgi:hypothetical protein